MEQSSKSIEQHSSSTGGIDTIVIEVLFLHQLYSYLKIVHCLFNLDHFEDFERDRNPRKQCTTNMLTA